MRLNRTSIRSLVVAIACTALACASGGAAQAGSTVVAKPIVKIGRAHV